MNDIFNKDVLKQGSYLYYTDKLSCKLANARINKGIQEVLDCRSKSFLDIGCGDGTTALEMYQLGARQVVGLDPAADAVEVANRRCASYPGARFWVDDVYTCPAIEGYDVVLFSRVLHHMPDPCLAIRRAGTWADKMMIIEPNGLNPVLKLLEKFSPYHVAHQERSYQPSQIRKWLYEANFSIIKQSWVNLVPMFCPDWLAKCCKFFEPMVERLPGIRNLCCGQVIFYAQRNIV